VLSRIGASAANEAIAPSFRARQAAVVDGGAQLVLAQQAGEPVQCAPVGREHHHLLAPLGVTVKQPQERAGLPGRPYRRRPTRQVVPAQLPQARA
jgi:hypothetical protein